MLEILEEAGRKCTAKCSCGVVKEYYTSNVKSGKSRSCGCSKVRVPKEVSRTWSLLKYRCNNPNSPDYKDYGGRGITVCPTWVDDVKQFYADMGDKPEGKTIDRIDNEKGYSKDNCRWATGKEQSRNRSVSKMLTILGETKNLMDWSDQFGIKPGTIRERLRRGWSDEDAVMKGLQQ